MSSASIDFATLSSIRRKPRGFALALAAGGAAALVLMAPQAWSVWDRNTFLDPDDALRAVEIRDFLAGQSWFDIVPHRLSPAHPFPMHWSRLVDAPLGGLQRLFEQVLPSSMAERAMRITAPILAFIAAFVAILRLTLRTAGPRGLVPAALLLATAAQPMTNFLPGHIHHHGVQAALLLLATACLVEAAGQGGRMRFAVLGGALAVLSLGIGLQNLPFVVGLVAAALLVWVVGGMDWRRCLAGFGGRSPDRTADLRARRAAKPVCRRSLRRLLGGSPRRGLRHRGALPAPRSADALPERRHGTSRRRCGWQRRSAGSRGHYFSPLPE